MKDEARIDLETQLEEARAAWQQAEEMGAEFAQRAVASDEELKALKVLFGHVRSGMKDDAKRILALERWIAFLAGIFIYLLVSILEGTGFFLNYPNLKLKAYVMCGAPLLYLYLRNRWREFQLKHQWNSWRDNDFMNDIRQSWNGRSSH